WAGSVAGTVHERPELTVPLSHPPQFPFALPGGALHVHLTAWVAGRPLMPILVTEIDRRRFDILADDDQPMVAELALDRVHLRARGGDHPVSSYAEVEIEARRGNAQEIAELAHLLQQQFALSPSTSTKFARGFALVHGASPAERRDPMVQAQDTLGDAARK